MGKTFLKKRIQETNKLASAAGRTAFPHKHVDIALKGNK